MTRVHLRIASLAVFFWTIAGTTPAALAENWQEDFDPIPLIVDETNVSTWTSTSGFVYHYRTFGPADGDPVLYLAGAGASRHQGFALLSPFLTTVDQLGLRFIAIERPGAGLTPLDLSTTVSSIVDDSVGLMEDLGYPEFAVYAVSAGGMYGDNLLLRHPTRVTRAVFFSGVRAGLAGFGGPFCEAVSPSDPSNPDPYAFRPFFQPIADHPETFASFFTGDGGQEYLEVLISIPDYLDAFIAWVADAYAGDGMAVGVEFYRCCVEEPTAWVNDIQAAAQAATMPVYIYTADLDAVPPADGTWREQLFPNTIRRHYVYGGHAVGLRHAGQALLDLAGVDKMMVCKPEPNGSHKTVIRNEDIAGQIVAAGGIYDICGWLGTPAE